MGMFDFWQKKAYKKVQYIVIEWTMQINELSVFLQLSYPPSEDIRSFEEYSNYLMSALILTACYKHNNVKFTKLLLENIRDDEKVDVYQGSVLSKLNSLTTKWSSGCCSRPWRRHRC